MIRVEDRDVVVKLIEEGKVLGIDDIDAEVIRCLRDPVKMIEDISVVFGRYEFERVLLLPPSIVSEDDVCRYSLGDPRREYLLDRELVIVRHFNYKT